jgi:hypothetical protein
MPAPQELPVTVSPQSTNGIVLSEAQKKLLRDARNMLAKIDGVLETGYVQYFDLEAVRPSTSEEVTPGKAAIVIPGKINKWDEFVVTDDNKFVESFCGVSNLGCVTPKRGLIALVEDSSFSKISTVTSVESSTNNSSPAKEVQPTSQTDDGSILAHELTHKFGTPAYPNQKSEFAAYTAGDKYLCLTAGRNCGLEQLSMNMQHIITMYPISSIADSIYDLAEMRGYPAAQLYSLDSKFFYECVKARVIKPEDYSRLSGGMSHYSLNEFIKSVDSGRSVWTTSIGTAFVSKLTQRLEDAFKQPYFQSNTMNEQQISALKRSWDDADLAGKSERWLYIAERLEKLGVPSGVIDNKHSQEIAYIQARRREENRK